MPSWAALFQPFAVACFPLQRFHGMTKATPKQAVVNVPIDKVSLHPGLPRTEFEQHELEPMAATVKRAGILNPPLARELTRKPHTHQLLSGARRLAAAVSLGEKSIELRVVRPPNDQAAWALVGIEQFERSDWSLIERAKYLQGLTDPDRGGYTYAQAAQLFGREDKSWTGYHIALLELPDVARHLLHVGKLLDLARGRILCRYRERPEVIEAICKALETNPEAFTPRDTFERTAERIAARFEPKTTATVSHVAGPRSEPPPTPKAKTPTSARPAARRATRNDRPEIREPSPATRQVTQSEIVAFLTPYRDDRQSLNLIHRVVGSWLAQLEVGRKTPA